MFALVPAAGTGTRMGEGTPKQYLPLAGRPMIHHALRALAAAPAIERVFLVLAPGDAMGRAEDWSAVSPKVVPLACGGATRAESVANGLRAATGVGDDDWVLVHDAARPCLSQAALAALVNALVEDAVGGLLAVRASDTLKRGNGDCRVMETVSRDDIWQAQTPQMFRRGLLLKALEQAGAAVTDEASAVEALGLMPRLVPGETRNIKVTVPQDLALAELILRSMAQEKA
ncbi:MAG TPA: 2-C-methyl-D-erythritol 4-phosphate cytidylyltransferase [Burkholderiales bacterium]